MRGAYLVVGCALSTLSACASSPTASSSSGPTLTSAELSALATLSPPSLPAVPPDVSNRFADHPEAALFGQKLFFERSFAGRLLDGDQDGGRGTLGTQGQTGKVSCADCHVPDAGFLDNRTLGQQI